MILTVTSKRQVTFPKAVCEELDLEAGGQIELVAGKKNNEWLLKPVRLDRTKLAAASARIRKNRGKAANPQAIINSLSKEEYDQLRR